MLLRLQFYLLGLFVIIFILYNRNTRQKNVKVSHSLNKALIHHLRILEKCGVKINNNLRNTKFKNVLTAHEWYNKVVKNNLHKKSGDNLNTNKSKKKTRLKSKKSHTIYFTYF